MYLVNHGGVSQRCDEGGARRGKDLRLYVTSSRSIRFRRRRSRRGRGVEEVIRDSRRVMPLSNSISIFLQNKNLLIKKKIERHSSKKIVFEPLCVKNIMLLQHSLSY